MTNFKRPQTPERKEEVVQATRERLEREGLPDPESVPAPREAPAPAPDTIKQTGAMPVSATLPKPAYDAQDGDETRERDMRNDDADRPDVLPR